MTVNSLALTLMTEAREATDNAGFVTVVEGWVNDSLDEIAIETDWKFLQDTNTINTVASQPNYSLASLVREIRYLRFKESNEPIHYCAPQRLVAAGEDLERLGKPEFFWFDKGILSGTEELFQIRLFPIPNAIYELEAGVLYHPDFVLSAGHLPVNKELFLLLKDRVRSYILNDDRDYDGSDRAFARFQKGLIKLVGRENKKNADTLRMQPRDITGTQGNRVLARLDPNHF